MNDTPETPAAGDAASAPVQPKLQVMGQFIRDMSFENVAAQKGVDATAQPEIAVQVNLDARKRQADHQFEVSIKLKVEAKSKDKQEVIFLMELDYGGIFLIENVPDDQMHPFLLIECPRMIFPFVRRIVSDVTRDGGFPPLNLETIDFVALYRQEIVRRAAEQQQAQAAEGAPTN